jgi:glycosyltransferase involved in cell wall biosynthesis
MRHADGVVYNSRFGMDDVHARGIRPDCPEAVIHNGCKRMKRASLEHPVFLVACETYDMPAKARALRDAVAGITELRKNIWDAKLWVAGKAPKMEGVDRYLGKVSDQERLAEERSKVAALVHLVEGDQCPNTVVEALAQGIPVLCHANSGTPEVIQWYGQSIGDTTAKKVALELSMIWVRAPAWQSECLKTFDETLRIDRVAKEYGNFLEELKCTNSCS